MKIHKLTLSFLIITVILIGLHVWRMIAYQTFARENYSLSISVAEHHPIMGKFEFITENKNQSITISEDYKEDDAYWGFASGSQFKNLPPPYTLSCHWVSLRERKIYKGTFELPHKTIDSLFKLEKSKMNKFTPYNGPHAYGYNFGVGIAPGGMVTVWASGNHYFQKEIATYQAKEFDSYNWNAFGDELLNSLPENFDSNSKETDSIIKNNIPPEMEKWKNFSKKYLYYVQIIGFSDEVTSVDLECFNEESNRFKDNNGAKQLIYTGVPNHIDINKTELDDRKSYRLSEDYMISFKQEKKNLATGDTLVFVIEKSSNDQIKTIVTTTSDIE
ncbi:DUF2931 family protein [Cellulophaga sp. 20_2_10]|uniref:DUF2931 family protein n=1 Tax=Cellulophaga sp. 20_2_10 TaxID=2942476 RepID=UPI00201ADA5D|nr:DUF2931 family protein [Cellulophaga sp. 20_2_10]MCL5246517.1 DUF2931 family protein [Cellulophaga sp. 20_2_10]